MHIQRRLKENMARNVGVLPETSLCCSEKSSLAWGALLVSIKRGTGYRLWDATFQTRQNKELWAYVVIRKTSLFFLGVDKRRHSAFQNYSIHAGILDEAQGRVMKATKPLYKS